MRALAILAALAGCTTYAHKATHNAPGLVDLDTAPARERGDPQAYESPRSPGTETYVVFAMPSILMGSGRLDTGQMAVEPQLAFRLERTVDAEGALLHKSAFAVTAGVGLAQFTDTRPTIFGATFVELNYRNVIKVIPWDVGVGPAFYPVGKEVGAQLSVRMPLLLIRARYLSENGFEIMGGYEVPIPFFFGRSR